MCELKLHGKTEEQFIEHQQLVRYTKTVTSEHVLGISIRSFRIDFFHSC